MGLFLVPRGTLAGGISITCLMGVEYMYQGKRLPGSVVYEDGGYDLSLAKQSVGQGWHGILERLFMAKPEWMKVVQVKEKFGGLRFYLQDGRVRVDFIGVGSLTMQAERAYASEEQEIEAEKYEQMVQAAEAESFKICEDCGAPGSPIPGGWIRTLCKECNSKRLRG